MSPISALLLVRLINGYSVLCTITGVIEVNMGEKWGGEGWRVHNPSIHMTVIIFILIYNQ